MTASPKFNVKVVFSAVTSGKPSIETTRVHTLQDCKRILDTFQKHGHNEIDTARVYGQDLLEEYFGDLNQQDQGLVIETKLYSAATRTVSGLANTYSHSAKDVRAGLVANLKAPKTDKLEIFYLHGLERNTSFENTVREINKPYEEGHFKHSGISNYCS